MIELLLQKTYYIWNIVKYLHKLPITFYTAARCTLKNIDLCMKDNKLCSINANEATS